MKNIFLASIHTNAGKTHASAVLCASFGYEYFKLIQAGTPSDSEFMAELNLKYCAKNPSFLKTIKIHKAGFDLAHACSPHAGMIKENLNINGLNIKPAQNENLLIELAGGLFTPLDREHFMIDYVEKYDFGVFLVACEYLGSINHTALSIEALKARNIKLLGVIFSNCQDELSKDFLKKHYNHIKFFELLYFDDEKSLKNACISLKEQILISGVLDDLPR